MLAALLVAMMVQAAPQAPTPPAPPIVIHNADWEEIPSGRAFRAFYPKAARKGRIEGRATVLCRVTARGALTQCKTVEEAPSGWGFGDAALRLAPKFRMKPETPSGQSVAGGSITIPMVFKIP